MTWHCQCDSAGACGVFGRTMTPLQHAVCRGERLTPEKCERMRQVWERLAATNQEVAMALSPAEFAELAGDADPTLIGNKVARFLKLHGVAPCEGCNGRRRWLNRLHRFCKSFVAAAPVHRPTWISTKALTDDVYKLAAKLPADLVGIVGVSRSGLLPASLLSMHLHLPMWILRQDRNPQQPDSPKGDIIPAGNGWRLHTRRATKGAVLLVDDTQMTGRSLALALPIAREWAAAASHRLLTAVVYQSPESKPKADLHVRELFSPHFLEWNLFNSCFIDEMAFDFDGIFCRDATAAEDDDGERYRKFLTTAEPVYLVRKEPVPLIVTGCLGKWRKQRQAWMQRHGIRAKRLVMGPWKTNAERAEPGAVSRFKAQHFAESGLEWFVESCPIQAREIVELSGKVVICPAAGKVF
jgi:orotate phosphoribosyltransferase